MTDLNDGLILHLPLTGPLSKGPVDRSPYRHEVHVGGKPRLIADPHLGAAHRFRTDDSLRVAALKLTTAPLTFTIGMWVRHEAVGDAGMDLFTLGDPRTGSVKWTSWPDGTCLLDVALISDIAFATRTELRELLPAGRWTHLAVAYDATTFRIWKDGALADSNQNFAGFSPSSSAFGLLGGANPGDVRWAVAFAQIRVHDRALAQEEILAQIAADRTLRSAYVDTHPVVLSLLDRNEVAAIYMTEDPSGEPLELEFFNVAGRPVYLHPLDGQPGRNLYHFELRFRPGTLHKSAATPGPDQLGLRDTASWAISAPVANPDGTVSFFLLHLPEHGASLKIDHEQAIRLALTNVRADPAAGARTSRLEIRYANLHLGDAEHTVLNGARISHFSILSHIGRSRLPLHVAFIGGNTILPGDGVKDNQLHLGLTNVSPDLPIPWIPGKPGDDPNRGTASCLQVYFDYQREDESKDWAFARLDEALLIEVTAIEREYGLFLGKHTGAAETVQTTVGAVVMLRLTQPLSARLPHGHPVVYQHASGARFEAIVVSVPGLPANALVLDGLSAPHEAGAAIFAAAPKWMVTSAAEGEPPVWTIWSPEATHLLPGDRIDLVIDRIVTSLPPGPANLYLRYFNIPGYQSGDLIATVEKSPLTVNKNGRVGIGTNDPQAALQVGGNDHWTLIDPAMVSIGNGYATTRIDPATVHVSAGDATTRIHPAYLSVGNLPNGACLSLSTQLSSIEVQSEAGTLRLNPGGNSVSIGPSQANAFVGVGINVPDPVGPLLEVGGGAMVLRSATFATDEFIKSVLDRLNYGDLLIVPPADTQATEFKIYWKVKGPDHRLSSEPTPHEGVLCATLSGTEVRKWTKF